MRNWWLLLLVVSLMCAWASFSVAQEIPLRVAMAEGKNPKEDLEEFFEPFVEMNPGIKLEVANTYGGDVDKMIVEMLGGVGADVFVTYNEAAVLAMRKGFSLDLTP